MINQMKQPRKRSKNFSQDEYNRLKYEELARMQAMQVVSDETISTQLMPLTVS